MPARKRRGPKNTVLAIRLFGELARSLGRVFEAAGFTPTGPRLRGGQASIWWAVDADSTRFVELRRSSYWERTRGVFTVELGVHLPAVERVRGRPEALQGIGASYCTTMHSLGALVREWGGMLWTLDEHTDVRALARELGALWASHGLPWLEHNRTVASACAWRTEILGDPGVVYRLAAGERSAARVALRAELLARHDKPDYVDYLLDVAIRHGLLHGEDADPVRSALVQELDARADALDRILDARRE